MRCKLGREKHQRREAGKRDQYAQRARQQSGPDDQKADQKKMESEKHNADAGNRSTEGRKDQCQALQLIRRDRGETMPAVHSV